MITVASSVWRGDAREIREYRGLSTDTKPTENECNGSVFFEIDTSKVYMYDEASHQWREI